MENNDLNITQMDSRERLRNLSFQPGDVIAGRYEYVRKLGQGGMGMVCLCKDRKDGGREVALKTVPDILRNDDRAVEALRKEYRSMLALTHDDIVAVRNLEDDEFRYYIVMDYAEGETLEAYLKTHRQPGLEVTLEVVSRLAIALDYAHGKGLVHRDVKPGNVMVQIDGNNVKSVKLLDFGLGLHIRESVSHVSGVMTGGTPAYKSPEQWRPDLYDGKLTPRADQYSLAVLAYEMLCGHYPFYDFDLATFPNAVLNVQPPKIDGLTDVVNNALQKALAKKPEDRFENCTAFVEVMEAKSEESEPTVSLTITVGQLSTSNFSEKPTETKHKLPEIHSTQKSSSTKYWILGLLVLICILALIAGLSAERGKSKGLEKHVFSELDVTVPLTFYSYKRGEDRILELNGVKMTLKYVQAGNFMMGCEYVKIINGKTEITEQDEKLHHVTLTQDFWLGETEVTQEQYETVMGKNPSQFNYGSTYPVENVSWNDAIQFCARLTRLASTNGTLPKGYEYTLPTEAQWEYAARGGTRLNKSNVYSGGEKVESVAWYDANSKGGTHPVGRKKANELGLYDMSGNVSEWCLDSCDYDKGVITDTYHDIWDPYCRQGERRVLRGGSWFNQEFNCRLANRNNYAPWHRDKFIGFRIALAPVK